MKNILNLYLIIFCLFFVAGCSSDEDATPVKLTILKSDLDMKASGGTGTVEFAATGPVTAKVNVDWCQVTEVTDSKVTISVDVNTGYPGRSTQIVLTDGVSTQQATILQEGAIWKYNKDDTEFRIDNEAGELSVVMSSSLPIEIHIPEAVNEWLSYELTDEGFNFIVKKNETGLIRATSVVVKTGERETKYTIMQYNASDLLGEWGGAAYMYGMGLNNVYGFSPNPTITGSDEDGYTLTLPMVNFIGTSIVLNMTYSQGMFLIRIPQLQNFKMSGLFAIMVGADENSYYYSGRTLAIAPVLLKDGSVVLTCVTDVYLMFGLYTTATPSNNSFTGNSIEFPIMQLFR